MKTNNYLQSIYDINKETGHYVIKTKVRRYKDIFNDLDNYPLTRRDINCDVQLYLHDCSLEIPFKYGIDLCFYITTDFKDSEVEELVRLALKTYYSFNLRLRKRTLKESYKCILQYMVIAFILLFLNFFLESKWKKGIVYNTLLEGFNIGGWIFLWEAISLLFFKQKEIRNEIFEHKRFLNATISFVYDIKK